MVTASPGLSYAFQVRCRVLLSLHEEWKGKLQSVPSDNSPDNLDWGPTCEDHEEFRLFKEIRTFRTDSHPLVVPLPASQDAFTNAKEDAELEDDNDYDQTAVDDTEHGDLLELAEQIENDCTNALLLELVDVNDEALGFDKPSKRYCFTET